LLPAEAQKGSRPRRILRKLRTFLLGYVAGLIFFAGAFYWLGSLGVLFENRILYGIPLLLAGYMALYFGFWTWFIGSVIVPRTYRFGSSGANLAIGLLAAMAWMAHEWVRGWFLSGFGWNGLSTALHHNYDLALIQIADITGGYGLSGLIVFWNVMVVVIVRRVAGDFGPAFLKRVRWEFSAAVLVVALVFVYGVRAFVHPTPVHTATLHCVALQPNIPESWKFDRAEDDRVLSEIGKLNSYAAETRWNHGDDKPDLIVWPEAAVPKGVFSDETTRAFLQHEVERGDFSLLTGSLDYDYDSHQPNDQISVYNAAMLFTAHGDQLESYRKIHLVPFGEYVPYRPYMPKIVDDLVPGDLAMGRDFTVLTLPHPNLRLGALVCFEDTLGDLCRHFSINGAQLLVNITNDAWFLHTAGAEQHLDNAILRAVENRRPLLRCANTGITCVIDSFGRIDRGIAPFEQGYFSRAIEVPTDAPVTFYARHGDWCAHLGSIVTVACLCWAGLRKRRLSVH
jgi:apolipoprotein N-acyltransferase